MRHLAAAAALAVACASCSADDGRVTVTIQQGDRRLEITAEVADAPQERIRGLRGRRSLPADQGMVFLFEDLQPRVFTMQGVLIPLDLLVIRRGRLLEVIEMSLCDGGPADCEYRTLPADAALELPGGTARQAGLAAGALVDIPSQR